MYWSWSPELRDQRQCWAPAPITPRHAEARRGADLERVGWLSSSIFTDAIEPSSTAVHFERGDTLITIANDRPTDRTRIAPYERELQVTPWELDSQPPVNPARRNPAIKAGQRRMISQIKPER